MLWWAQAMRCWWLLFFFFKQNTAYELRISDWSSDVCSSDLMKAKVLHEDGERTIVLVFETGDRVIEGLLNFARTHAPTAGHFTANGAFQDVTLDRKRAVKGKRGQVRVGPGGHRFIKKKNAMEETYVAENHPKQKNKNI